MTYVLSNPHGEYGKFKEMLEQIGFSDNDVLYVLGDIVDYGEESMELIGDLSVRYNVLPIAGEHDYLAAKMLSGFSKMLLEGGTPDEEYVAEMGKWMALGGKVTLDGFRALDDDMQEGVLDYLSDMALYEEVTVSGQDYLLVHAGIAGYQPGDDLEDFLPEDFLDTPLDPRVELDPDKIVVAGHVPTPDGKILRGNGCILIDSGVEQGGKLACLCLDNGKEYYV